LARLLFTVAQKITLAIGVVGCPWSAGCACGAKSIGIFAIQKKYDRKTALWAVVASKLDSRMFIVLLRGKSEGWTNERHERTHGREQGPFSDSFDPTCNYFAALSISWRSKPIFLPSSSNTGRFS
jgi:hypothetical protein